MVEKSNHDTWVYTHHQQELSEDFQFVIESVMIMINSLLTNTSISNLSARLC